MTIISPPGGGSQDPLPDPSSPRHAEPESAAPGDARARQIVLPARLPAVHKIVASLQQIYLALYAAEVGIWEWNVEQNTVTWSMFVDKIFGLPPEGTIYSCETLFQRIPPEDLARARAVLVQALNSDAAGQRFEFQVRVQRMDGEWRWIAVAGSVGRSAELCLLGTVQDVTERRSTENEASFYRALLEHLNEAGQDGILVVSEDQRILFYNNRFTEIWGMPEELVESGDMEVLADWAREAVTEPDTAVFRKQDTGGQPDPSQHDELRLRDGRVIERFRVPVFSREGLCLGRVWHFRDRTESLQFKGQFLHTQRLESLGSVASGIAHELRNILTPIVAHTQVLSEELGANHPAQASLSEVMKGCERARNLIRQILTFSRRDSSHHELVDLAAVVAEGVKLLEATIPESVVVRTSLAADLPPVLADATQIEQVVMNLAINAWHAFESGSGIIDIALDEVTLGAETTETVPELGPGRYARLSVRDNGVGMDEVTLQRIFEPFFTTKPNGSGTGLGLSVVHGIVRSHQGAITVESQPGQGTLFRLYFPLTPTAGAAPAQPT